MRISSRVQSVGNIMAKADLGLKRTCLSGGMRYYDFNRTPIVCPGCQTEFDPEAVIREALDHAPDAITMPYLSAEAGLMAAVIEGTGLPVYVHTINRPRTTACLLAAGAAGVYSDDLGQAEVEALADADVDCH